MKKLAFTKMVGAGNDFLVLDGRKGINYKKLAPKMCDRTNGIGADGLLVIDRPAGRGKTDYRMRIINADGSEAEMCGNGARCTAVYLKQNKKFKKKTMTIQTLAGTILGEANGTVARVRLSDPKDYRPNIPLEINGHAILVHAIDTGVPHAVIFVDALNEIKVDGIGPSIRFHEAFAPRGANVNFVEQLGDGLVAARTYERGVEGETKACGTGSVASALIAWMQSHPGVTNKKGAKMKVLTASGEILEVTFDLKDEKISNVWLKGSAEPIATGTYYTGA